MAVRVDLQYVHCCCVHSTHCEWRTIGPRVHITMERIEADRILPTHRPNTVVRHTKHQLLCYHQFLCVYSAKLLGCVKSEYLSVLIGAGMGNEVLT